MCEYVLLSHLISCFSFSYSDSDCMYLLFECFITCVTNQSYAYKQFKSLIIENISVFFHTYLSIDHIDSHTYIHTLHAGTLVRFQSLFCK